MPTTVNGVGTHYYGKKNQSVRTAPCRSCGRVANLVSYDTRLWFVVVFIPVIPLGRKRVIDECPSCRRHFVANADAYEQARQLQVSAAQDQFRRDPSPGAALQVHAALLNFHEAEQAAEFRRSARERFPADAELAAGLGAQLEPVGAWQEAFELYEEAYRLQPELPEARAAIARKKMAEGELEEARRLLDYLEEPGAGQHYPLGPIDMLSVYYQKARRHEEALELAAHLLAEIPAVGQQHKFRGFVARSEKALGRMESILPPREHSLRGLFSGESHIYSKGVRWAVIGGVGAALLAAGLAINNEYIRRHRTIHVVNACGAPVQVQVDDGPSQSVGNAGQVVVGEGRHRIRLGGPVDETHEVELAANYFDRWFKKPACVLIPGAEAVLVRHTIYYARNPTPSQHGLIFGQPFVSLPHVDYAFVPPPQSLEIKGNGPVVKEALEFFPGSDIQAFQAVAQIDRRKAMDFIERRLRRHPEDQALLKAYYYEIEGDEYQRAEAFLLSGLDHRPVAVPWHRRYQVIAERNGHFEGVPARYDGYLSSDPGNAALLYLRGRIEPDRARAEDYWRGAVQADARLPWPWEGRAARAASAARWDECLRHLSKARDLKIDEEIIEDSAMAARIGSGDAKGLATELRARLAGNAMDFETLRDFMEAVAVSEGAEQVEREVNGWLMRIPQNTRELASAAVRSMTLYETGKLAECEELCRRTINLRDSVWRLHCLLGLKRTREATEEPALRKHLDEPWDILAVSLAWSLEGKSKEAGEWMKRATAMLEKMGPDLRRLASMLGSTVPPRPDDVTSLFLGPRRQALALALLARRFPAQRTAYLEGAARYNLRRVPPYQLVRQAIEAGASTASPSTAKR